MGININIPKNFQEIVKLNIFFSRYFKLFLLFNIVLIFLIKINYFSLNGLVQSLNVSYQHLEIYSNYILSVNCENRKGLCEIFFYEPKSTFFIMDFTQNWNFVELSCKLPDNDNNKNIIPLESTLDLKNSEDRSNNKRFYIGLGGTLVLVVTVICLFISSSKGDGGGGGGTSFPDDKISKIIFEKKIDAVERSSNNSGLLVERAQMPVEVPSLNANLNTGAILQQIENIGQLAQTQNLTEPIPQIVDPDPINLPPIPQLIEPVVLDNSPRNPVTEVPIQEAANSYSSMVNARERCVTEMVNLTRNINIREARLEKLNVKLIKTDGDRTEIELLKKSLKNLRTNLQENMDKFHTQELEFRSSGYDYTTLTEEDYTSLRYVDPTALTDVNFTSLTPEDLDSIVSAFSSF